MRDLDWSRSPLGHPQAWPQSLRSVAGLLLNSRFPMFAAWGSELGFIYNDAYAEILGAKHPRAMGSRFHDIWSEIWADISPLIDAALAGQATYREDLPLVMNRKGFDEHTWFTFSYSPVRDESGKVAGMFCAVFETTGRVVAERELRELNESLERRVDQMTEERRNAEKALRHAQKMEALGQLTGGVAHDFNNLLAVFANGLQVLQHDPPPAQRQRIHDGMRRAIARGSGLTRHLLAFSRTQPVNPQSINLHSCLANMRDMLERSLRGDVHVSMDLDGDLWPVMVDVGELELAVLNLCVNARDAMSGSGTITISARNVHEASAGGEQEMVRLSVRDEGCGMPPEVQARAFEPFFTTKDVGKGSGLGLPQVYGFAQQSGGRVSIQSEMGKGTVVEILLPRATAEAVEPGAETGRETAAALGGTRRGHVLLVEDDNEVAGVTREMLGSLGFVVTHAPGPAAALGALADLPSVDYVLSDVMMPGGISGVNLAEQISLKHPGVRVVLATGYPESAANLDRERFALLMKPYTVEQLDEALRPQDGMG
jgi:signal transduction histidine kinase